MPDLAEMKNNNKRHGSLPVGAPFKLTQHHKVLPELQNSLQHLEIRILLQVVAVVEAARPPRLHVCYSLMLDGPWVGGPAIAVHIQGVCVLHEHLLPC